MIIRLAFIYFYTSYKIAFSDISISFLFIFMNPHKLTRMSFEIANITTMIFLHCVRIEMTFNVNIFTGTSFLWEKIAIKFIIGSCHTLIRDDVMP